MLLSSNYFPKFNTTSIETHFLCLYFLHKFVTLPRLDLFSCSLITFFFFTFYSTLEFFFLTFLDVRFCEIARLYTAQVDSRMGKIESLLKAVNVNCMKLRNVAEQVFKNLQDTFTCAVYLCIEELRVMWMCM